MQFDKVVTRKVLLYCLGVVGLSVAAWLVWVQVSVEIMRVKSSRDFGEHLAEVTRRTSLLAETLTESEVALSQISTVAPLKAMQAQTFERLDQIARQNNVKLNLHDITENVNNEIAGEVAAPVRVSLLARGDVEAVLQFLQAVENEPTLFMVDSFSLAPTTDDEGKVIYALSADVIMFLISEL